MASTYSELKVELITTGEQSGTWGDTTNTNLSTALGEAITGSADAVFSSADLDLVLTDTNASQVARNLRLNITGTLGASRYLYLSTGCNIEKLYLINNPSAYAVTVQNKIGGFASGSTVTIPAGKSTYIYNTGTNIVDAVTHLSSLSLTTPLAVTSGGTGGTTSTGSGAVVLATSPTLVTPALGTPTSGNFGSGTFTWPTFNQNTTGNALTATNATSATTATNLAGGLAFKIPYQTASNITSFIGTPTDNTYLKYNTAGGFTWATIGGGTAYALTMNNGGTGDASGATFDGNAAKTISWNTIGASPLAGSSSLTTTGTVTSGTWSGSFGAVSGANLTNLNASNLASGTVGTARLGTGTASSSTYLRGDGTWATVATGTTTYGLTVNATGSGTAPGFTFNGSSDRFLSYNSVGAPSTTGANASGTWNINITGNAATATSATTATGLSSTLSIGGGGTGVTALPSFSAYATSNQTLTVAVPTKALFAAENWDTSSCFASSRFTPTTAGYYQLSGVIRFNPGSGTTGYTAISVEIYKNGAAVSRAAELITPNAIYTNVPFCMIHGFNGSTDYAELYVSFYNYSGTVGTGTGLQYDSAVLTSFFQGSFVRA